MRPHLIVASHHPWISPGNTASEGPDNNAIHRALQTYQVGLKFWYTGHTHQVAIYPPLKSSLTTTGGEARAIKTASASNPYKEGVIDIVHGSAGTRRTNDGDATLWSYQLADFQLGFPKAQASNGAAPHSIGMVVMQLEPKEGTFEFVPPTTPMPEHRPVPRGRPSRTTVRLLVWPSSVGATPAIDSANPGTGATSGENIILTGSDMLGTTLVKFRSDAGVMTNWSIVGIRPRRSRR